MSDALELRLASAEDALDSGDRRLVDLIDGLLDHGIVVRGELWLTVAGVDLVYVGLDLVLANPDTIRGRRPA